MPVYAASALKNIGVQPLLDGVLAFLPSPLDRGAVAGVDPAGKLPKSFEPDPSAPLAALVFKVSMLAITEDLAALGREGEGQALPERTLACIRKDRKQLPQW